MSIYKFFCFRSKASSTVDCGSGCFQVVAAVAVGSTLGVAVAPVAPP